MIFLCAISLLIGACEDTLETTEFGTISGTVLDAYTSEPLQGATLSTNPASSSVITDENGSFSISNVPIGEVTLTAKKIQYKTTSVNISIQALVNSQTDILLEKSSGYQLPSGSFSNPRPAQGDKDVLVNDTLKWSFIPDKEVDSIEYNIRIYESSNTEPVFDYKNVKDSFLPGDLEYNTTYYWQVTALSADSTMANSELWSFTTETRPLLPILFAKGSNGNYDIYASDTTNNSSIHNLTDNGSFIDWYPRNNPVTGTIAFISNRNTSMQIYTMNESGEDVKQVTTIEVTGNYNKGSGFCWSPNGSALLYPHYDKLYRINSDGTGLVQLATAPEGRQFTACDWSDYANKIVVQTTGNNPYDNELYLMNADGTGMTLFVDNLPGVVENPVFSVDGQRVMYTHDADGLNSWDGRQLNARIYLRAINDTTATDLSFTKPAGTNDLMPVFSSDGAKIIFVNTNNVPGSQHSIYIASLDGTNRMLVYEGATMPHWRNVK